MSGAELSWTEFNFVSMWSKDPAYSALGHGFKGRSMGPADGVEAGSTILKRFGVEECEMFVCEKISTSNY
uniref:Uncharacterized protein n=1 Tax=Romanomermis culicivorax TaxID=13658 RepID=A0A915L9F3_ROMCU